jgi:hypothetical protein
MIEFLQSLRSDLSSRRLLPFVALAAVALIAAVAYAVTGGSSGSAPAPVASLPSISVTGSAPALPVTVAPSNPNEAVSETPGGVRFQSQGPTRDPFVPLPSPPAAKAAESSSSSSGSASSSTGSSAGGSSSSGSGSTSKGSGGGQEAPAPAKPSKPAKPAKPQNPYTVAVLFGSPSSIPGQPATLVPYPKLSVGQALPSKQDARIVFERVTSDGKGAVFKLVVPPILHGTGICLPNPSDCQAIDLEVDKYEVLEYVEANGQSVTYEVGVASITKNSGAANTARVKRTADTARVKRLAQIMRAESKAPTAGG